MLKQVVIVALALAGAGLCLRALYAWTTCGYDCRMFPLAFPLDWSATFGGIVGVVLLILLGAVVLGTLMASDRASPR